MKKTTNKQNRLDKDGETILASEGIDIENLDLEEMTEPKKSKKSSHLNTGANVKLVIAYKLTMDDQEKEAEYEGALKEFSTFAPAANLLYSKTQNITFFLGLDSALELANLNLYTISYIKSLKISYILNPSKALENVIDLTNKQLTSVSISNIKNGVAAVFMQIQIGNGFEMGNYSYPQIQPQPGIQNLPKNLPGVDINISPWIQWPNKSYYNNTTDKETKKEEDFFKSPECYGMGSTNFTLANTAKKING